MKSTKRGNQVARKVTPSEMSAEDIWKFNAEQVVNAVPALGRRDASLAKQMIGILERNPMLAEIENGFLVAYMVLRRRNIAHRNTA